MVVVTGGSAGLGLAIARAFRKRGYSVVILGRDQTRLDAAAEHLMKTDAKEDVLGLAADLSDSVQVTTVFSRIVDRYGRIDVLINNVGASDRGTVEGLNAEHLLGIIQANVVPALLCSQAALASLEKSGGVVLNIGSLAGKVGARYLGGYPAAKHALAGLSQQMRLEWKSRGVHVGIINPGPIRRDDAGQGYAGRVSQDDRLPEQANRPGGGTRVKGQLPEVVAEKVVRMVLKRQADVMLPGHLRPLVAIGNLWPAFGDWLLLKFTSSKK